MITINDIKSGQRWKFKSIKRGDVEISHVNESSNTIYWYYVDYSSNVFDSPFEKFMVDFAPRDESIGKPEKPGPNDDRDFLL